MAKLAEFRLGGVVASRCQAAADSKALPAVAAAIGSTVGSVEHSLGAAANNSFAAGEPLENHAEVSAVRDAPPAAFVPRQNGASSSPSHILLDLNA